MIRKLKLSAVCTQPTPTIHCIQFDTDRQIELCFDDIELAGLQEARIYGKKPDGTEFYNDCTIEDGKLIAPLTSQALAVKGIVPCQIQLVFGGTLTTYTFNVVVDDSLVSESAIESSNEYTALENALAEVEEIIGEIGDGIVKSVNGLKNDISLVDGDSTTVTTDTENGEISVNVAADNSLSDASENPVQNKIIKSALDGKLNLTGGTMTGDLNMGRKKITGLDTLPLNNEDAVAKKYVDTQDALNEKLANKVTKFTGDETDTEYPSAKLVSDALDGKLDLTGGTMQGLLNMSNGRIINLPDPINNNDAVSKKYVEALKNEQGGLIYSTTLSEDTRSIIINKTNDDESFALKEFCLTIKIPASTELQSFAYIGATLRVYNRNATPVNNKTVISGGTNGRYHNVVFNFSLKNMRWEYSTGTTLNANLNNETAEVKLDSMGYVLSNAVTDYEKLKCEQITLTPTGATANFPTGTIIEVYGK